MMKEKRRNRVFQVLVLAFSAIWIMPLLFSITNSFKSYNDIIQDFFALPKTVSFGIYKETWELLEMGEKSLNTLLYTGSTTLICAVLAPMAAYKLGRRKTKTTAFLTVLLVLPIMVPFTTYCVPLSMLMGKVGLTNTKIGYIIASVGLNLPFCIHVIRSFVDTIPLEIEESAVVDGANPLQLFFQIVYPLLLPAISTVSIITAVGTWCDMIVCKILAGSSESLLNIQTKLFSRFSTSQSDWTHAFPAIVISCLPTIVFFLIMQKKVVAGVSAGAIKG